MNYPVFNGETLFIASDFTAGIFLIVLIISIAFKSERRPGLSHLLASAILELAGMFLQLLADTIEMLPSDFAWKRSSPFLMPVAAPWIWILSFLFIIIGITESATYVIYINGDRKKFRFRTRCIATGIIFAAGIILYSCFGSLICFPAAILTHMIFLYLYMYRSCNKIVIRQFGRASLAAFIPFAITLFFGLVRLTGLGLSVMLIILNEQYHHIVEHELVENEEELTKNKVQLLAKQISPHYIYNSLQSIRDFCESDPAKARDVLDYFSEFLRGNLESLTVEEMVPFERELELTKAYLELEKITGREQFEVEYQLETTDFMLPPLVLQPVVENAVKYGTMRTAACMDPGESGVTEIIIATRKEGESICIEVTDKTKGGGSAAAAGTAPAGTDAYLQAGAPETPGSRGKKKSVGLENVRTRLAIQSGGTLDIESTDRGTKVTVLLRMMPAAAVTQKK